MTKSKSNTISRLQEKEKQTYRDTWSWVVVGVGGLFLEAEGDEDDGA